MLVTEAHHAYLLYPPLGEDGHVEALGRFASDLVEVDFEGCETTVFGPALHGVTVRRIALDCAS